MVHQERLDLSMTLLTGYSAFAEGVCGSVKLYALTPELTDQPTYLNCGTDALRPDWQHPTEQIQCSACGGEAVLSGWVYTKWARNQGQDARQTMGRAASPVAAAARKGLRALPKQGKDTRYVHNRRLGVTMTYEKDTLVLEFETLKRWYPEPIPTRLLFLLSVRPFDQSGRLVLGDREFHTPSAESKEVFRVEAPVAMVCFSAPDGSAIEILPELSHAETMTAERPPAGSALPANEGCLRLAFEGPRVLDRGRYRLRFIPGCSKPAR
jgi:hypothetical protein